MNLVPKKWVSGLQVGAIMSAYAAQASIGRLRFRDRDERLRYFTKNVSKWCARCLEAMKVDLTVHGYKPEIFKNQNFLIVGNHLSYVDILILSSIQPAIFVTSVDLGETKFLGPMAELGGSIFVERRNRAQISRDLGVMRETLRAGHNVVIFPEGTSSNGAGVLPFKKSLLMAAVDAQKDILPIVFKYTEIDGQPITESNRDRICWYGDMSFGPHFLDILGTRQLKAELHFLDPIPVTSETTRHGLAEEAHARISAVYGRPYETNSSEVNA